MTDITHTTNASTGVRCRHPFQHYRDLRWQGQWTARVISRAGCLISPFLLLPGIPSALCFGTGGSVACVYVCMYVCVYVCMYSPDINNLLSQYSV
jgi:hypothetical protein